MFVCWREMGEDEFGSDFDEFDEFGGRFPVCVRRKGVRLMSLGVSLMILAMGLDEDFRHEVDGDLDEFDEFAGHFLVCVRR